jgi:hypothetical protein
MNVIDRIEQAPANGAQEYEQWSGQIGGTIVACLIED